MIWFLDFDVLGASLRRAADLLTDGHRIKNEMLSRRAVSSRYFATDKKK
jgi:hypothetical protein